MVEPTYIFKDGHVYTLVDGQVVASVKEAEFNPGQEGGIEMPETPEELQGPTCPGCGQATEPQDSFCPHCGTALTEGGGPEMGGQYGGEAGLGAPQPVGGQMIAQTVTTPNGVKGRVLARVPGLWGDEVTIRFENGNIVKVPVDERLTFSASNETEAKSAAQSLEERLAAKYETDARSLVGRSEELKRIKREIKLASPSAPDSELNKLATIDVQASYELDEIGEALEAIVSGQQEAFAPPGRIDSMPIISQASTNGGDASWLDGVHADMIREGNEQDFTRLMDEGPEAFVASLSPEQLADGTTTRVMATREIEAKTVGADDVQKDAYARMWLARVEQQRKAAYTGYREATAEAQKIVSKEASSESHPDESLYL